MKPGTFATAIRGWNFGTRILGLWIDHDGVIHVVGDLPAAKPA